MSEQTIELQTVNGPLLVRLIVDDNKLLAGEGEKPSVEEGRGYRLSVLECHEILDDLQIPTAKGILCHDAKCTSPLGHRLRILRGSYQHAEEILSALREPAMISTLPQDARNILLNSSRSH